jgi:hypothetical protein
MICYRSKAYEIFISKGYLNFMFITVLFIMAKIQNQSRCVSGRIGKENVCLHNGILLSCKKNELLSFAAT